MKRILEKYYQYLEEPDDDGAKILYFAEYLLRTKNVGIKESQCCGISYIDMFNKNNSLSVEFYAGSALALVKQKTEFWPHTRLKKTSLNKRGKEFINKLIEKAKKDYLDDSIKEFNREVESLCINDIKDLCVAMKNEYLRDIVSHG